jgi:tetratricopeptide (TPR) repeat protein
MWITKYFALIFLFIGVSISYGHISHFQNNPDNPTDSNEALYLPNGKGLQFLSFGYRNALAHTLWFNTISYFGKHYQGDRNYQWLNHMCNLVTDLNPEMLHVYDFCSVMLAWEANFPDESIKILDKAILVYPDNWKLPYLRGMAYLIFLNDVEKAKDDFIRSSRLPDAHYLVMRLAARNISITDKKESAIEFLEEMIRNSRQESERGALIRKLEEIKSQN